MNRNLVLAGCLLSAFWALPFLSPAGEDLPALNNLPSYVTDQVRVTDYGVMIPIRDFRRSCTTGTRLPLLQENEYFYIAKVSTLEFGEQLCAFPKVDSLGVGTAWVTKEKLLIFGIPTRSVPGRFFLMKNEVLPVLEENDTEYVTLLERYGERIAFSIPKPVDGITREPIPPRPPIPAELATPEPRRITFDMAALEEMSPPAPDRKSAWRKSRPASAPREKKVPAPPPRELEPRQPEPTPAQTSPGEPPREEALAPQPATAGAGKAIAKWWSRIPVTVIVLQIFVIALATQVFLFLRRRKEPAAPAPAPMAEEVQTFSTLGESVATNYFHNLAHEAGDFSGSLEGFSITELVQFLHSAKETGVLLIKDASDKVTGEFFFEQGEIIDATHGEHRGESAIYSLFRGNDASFAFNRVEVGKRTRTITQATMGILLDASKTFDEEQEKSPKRRAR